MMANLEVTSDGWIVEDLDFFRILTDNRPPRPASFSYWLKRDVRGCLTVALWLGAASLIALAVTTGSYYLLSLALFLLCFYLICFFQTVFSFRDCPVEVGVIGKLSPHPLLKNY